MKRPLPLAGSDYKRTVAKEPYVALWNRYAEKNPVINDSPVSFIARPKLKKFSEVGTGHIRKIYPSVGVFDNDAFVVSNLNLYRISSATGASSDKGTISTDPLGDVSMAVTSPIGTTVPGYLFIAEGGVLWVYTDNGHALGHLQASGAIANNETVRIDGTYYKWTSGSVDTGTPAGSSGSPWLVKLGGTAAVSLTNLFLAIGNTGTPGTTYSTLLTAHTTVSPLNYSTADLYVQAKDAGTGGNAIVTTETMANGAWSAGTLQNGGSDQLSQVTVPDDVGAISVTHINSYIIVVPVQDNDLGTMGRFYWIQPGEVTINPLDFATAERSPDGIHQVLTFGDMFWLFGEKTTEPWITTGNADAPMERYQGILFDRGSWAGTAVNIKDMMVVVDEDGGVFVIKEGQRRISRPDIEERIRLAIQREGLLT